MFRIFSIISLIFIVVLPEVSHAQNPPSGLDPDIDMYMGSWKESMPRHTHGSLVERDILTRGKPMNPTTKGAVLRFAKRFVYATLQAGASTSPTILKGEQEIYYFISGKGNMRAGNKTAELYEGIAILMPANLEFTMTNTGDEPLTMYLMCEPIPEGFRPNRNMLVRDENSTLLRGHNIHWTMQVKPLFVTADGLGTFEDILTVTFDPMSIGHPHALPDGLDAEEVWTVIKGESTALLGKQIRHQPAGTGYMVPPDGKITHANMNTSDEQVKFFYFFRHKDHEVRK